MMKQRVVGHGLSEAFDQDHARNDGSLGEMAEEERLIGLKGPHGHHAVLAELDDPVDEEKGGPMRKDGGNARKRPGVPAHGDWLTSLR